MNVRSCGFERGPFFAGMTAGRPRAFLADYDGMSASFRVDCDQAVPDRELRRVDGRRDGSKPGPEVWRAPARQPQPESRSSTVV
jgi:hypothetical protein